MRSRIPLLSSVLTLVPLVACGPGGPGGAGAEVGVADGVNIDDN